MKNKKIIIAGGSGFIGQALCNYFGTDNEIVVLGRQEGQKSGNAFGENKVSKDVMSNIRYVHWDGVTINKWADEINGADLVINLAGKSVNCRYTEKNKKAIFDSRVNSTRVIGLAIQQSINPPSVWINAASATIYPHATDTPRDESFINFSDDFSVQVCKLWEKTFHEQRTPFTRKITLRMAIALGEGGVMIPYFNLLKYGLGGKQGSGKQMYSWVHIEDVCKMMEWIFDHPGIEGIYNCSSPNPVNNKNFMQVLRKETNTKFGLPAYKWMLKIGAALIGTETELILKSRWVIPSKILKTGFVFNYPQLNEAIKNIISKTPGRRYHLF